MPFVSKPISSIFMHKRNTQQRRRAIIDTLTARGEVTVEALAQQFATSEVTIRKDLAALEASGLLLRRYGGAVPVPQELMNDGGAGRISERKQALAQAAAELVGEHNRLFIDSRTTDGASLPVHTIRSRL